MTSEEFLRAIEDLNASEDQIPPALPYPYGPRTPQSMSMVETIRSYRADSDPDHNGDVPSLFENLYAIAEYQRSNGLPAPYYGELVALENELAALYDAEEQYSELAEDDDDGSFSAQLDQWMSKVIALTYRIMGETA